MFGSGNAKWQCFIALLGLTVYLCAASSLPISINLAQAIDDALFIKLGRAIADGHWLGHYNQLTLIKGPIYPIFLAFSSLTGLPFNIVQYIFYFFCCWYFASVLTGICRQTRWFAAAMFIPALLCPGLYMSDRVLREVFYAGLTLLLFAMAIELLFTERATRGKILFGIGTGIVGGAYWFTREESIWIVPALIVLVAGAFYNTQAPTLKVRAARLAVPLLATCLGAAAVVVTIGGLNRTHYGRFVTDEMRDSTFQRAMIALQRVGSTFQQPYLPVPKAARDLIYAQSPSFAKLQQYLEPAPGTPTFYCPQWQNTCGDLSGSWFMWGLRFAVDFAGVAHSAKQTARFYDSVATEIEAACQAGRLPCASWLPPFIPPITPAQWQMFPATLWQAVLLTAHIPPPIFYPSSSYLESGDSAAVIEFLNRPFATQASPTLGTLGSTPYQTASRGRIRSIWISTLGFVATVDRVLLAAGLASVVLVIALARRLFLSTEGIVAIAFVTALGTRLVILSLADISSFPAVQAGRVPPADTLALAAAIMSMHMLFTVTRGIIERRRA